MQPYLKSWSQDLGVPILSVDYSLAPEAPFPRALEECFYAYCWALRNHHLLGTHTLHTLSSTPVLPGSQGEIQGIHWEETAVGATFEPSFGSYPKEKTSLPSTVIFSFSCLMRANLRKQDWRVLLWISFLAFLVCAFLSVGGGCGSFEFLSICE